MTETRILRNTLILISAMTISLVVFLLLTPEFHLWGIRTYMRFGATIGTGDNLIELIEAETRAMSEEGVDIELPKQLRIEIPRGVNMDDVEIINRYAEHVIDIKFKGIDGDYFYDYPIIGNCDHIDDLRYESGDEGLIKITMDAVYEPDILTEGRYLYIDFVDVRSVYDTIIVIDAGHGHNDPGAVSGDVYEKNLNLEISSKIEEFFEDDESIGILYTRIDDNNPSYSQRVDLANDVDADLFISIHINSTSTGRTSGINGTAVMYKSSDDDERSLRLSEIMLDSVISALGSDSKGTIAGDDIYIIRNSEVPVTLIEVGFISNPEELEKLTDEEYQRSAAKAIHDGAMKALEEFNE